MALSHDIWWLIQWWGDSYKFDGSSEIWWLCPMIFDGSFSDEVTHINLMAQRRSDGSVSWYLMAHSDVVAGFETWWIILKNGYSLVMHQLQRPGSRVLFADVTKLQSLALSPVTSCITVSWILSKIKLFKFKFPWCSWTGKRALSSYLSILEIKKQV